MTTAIIEYVSPTELVDNKPIVNQQDIETLKEVLISEIPYTRKPDRWSELNHTDYQYINQICQDKLSLDLSILPTYDQDFVYGDMKDFTPFDDIADRLREEMIFTFRMNNGRLFLINTEGFGYCRYVFELTNPPAIKVIN